MQFHEKKSLIYLISRVFFPWNFLNFLARCDKARCSILFLYIFHLFQVSIFKITIIVKIYWNKSKNVLLYIILSFNYLRSASIYVFAFLKDKFCYNNLFYLFAVLYDDLGLLLYCFRGPLKLNCSFCNTIFLEMRWTWMEMQFLLQQYTYIYTQKLVVDNGYTKPGFHTMS